MRNYAELKAVDTGGQEFFGPIDMGASMRLKEFQDFCFVDEKAGLRLDLSWSGILRAKFDALQEKMARALKDMQALESGAIANPDEKRMVGHYWLRRSSIAPNEDLRKAIDNTLFRVKQFAADVHEGKILTPRKEKFEHVLLIGIGGSALGPQHVYQALRSPRSDPMDLFFFDNTDPDGMQRVLDDISDLAKTMVLVISKSGGTKETRNGQLVAKDAFEKAGLSFKGHFVAVTGEGSELDKTAQKEGWLERFPMWDWVGGRTSETSAVGMLPAALHGVDINELLRGAREMDELTRRTDLYQNPAALLSAAWYELCEGKGTRAMVLLPYSDRLMLFSKYLQQLIMESLGKKLDLDGNVVHQGISVYGNKGSTDQHAYVQQLRDGLDNFFVTFVEVLKDVSGNRAAAPFFVEEGITSGDYLGAFLQGTRQALYDENRPSITITVDEITPYTVGSLIAVFERAVGFYASLVNINAYHQPGVEAGKKAAGAALAIQKEILSLLARNPEALTLAEISTKVSAPEQTVASLLRRLAANGRVGVEKEEELRYKGI